MSTIITGAAMTPAPLTHPHVNLTLIYLAVMWGVVALVWGKSTWWAVSLAAAALALVFAIVATLQLWMG